MLLIASLASGALAGGEEPLSFEWLKKLIADNQVKSIEDLLPKLPAELRSNFVLMYESRSLQAATPAQPRIILSSKDGKFVLTVAGKADGANSQLVEVMAYNPETRKFGFNSVTFEGGAGARFEENPAKCKGCHSAALHPNWDTYPRWPGAYGSEHFTPNDRELANYRKFLAESADKGRYKALVDIPRAEGSSLRPGIPDFYHELSERNVRFTTALSELNFERIWEEIKSLPRYSRYRAALLAAFYDSANFLDFVPPEDRIRLRDEYLKARKQTDAAIKAYDAKVAGRQVALTGEPIADTYSHNMSKVGFDQPQSRLAKVRAILEEMGGSMENWAMTREAGSYAFANGANGVRDFAKSVRERLAAEEPALAEFLKDKDYAREYRIPTHVQAGSCAAGVGGLNDVLGR
jgi:hypothetical protein